MARRQLLAAGLTRRGVERRLEGGRLHLLHRGVYAVGHRRVGRLGGYMAAVLACGDDAALSHRSGGDLWAVRRTASPRVEVTVPRAARGPAGVVVHRGPLPPDEVTTHEGIPVTTVARTLLDLAGVLDAAALERAVAEAEARRLSDATSVHHLLTRYPRRRGARALRAALGHAGEGVLRSELEERFLALVDAAGLPRPRRNLPLRAGGREVEADFAWRSARLIVELDSRGWHDTRQAFERDRARDRELAVAGWRTVRVTWRQLADEPEGVAGDLSALLAAAR